MSDKIEKVRTKYTSGLRLRDDDVDVLLSEIDRLREDKDKLIDAVFAWRTEVDRLREELAQMKGERRCDRHNPCEMQPDGYCARCHQEMYP